MLKYHISFILLIIMLSCAASYSIIYSPVINFNSSRYADLNKRSPPVDLIQSRAGGYKEIWLIKNGDRVHYNIEAKSSEIRKVNNEIVEIMNDIKFTTDNDNIIGYSDNIIYSLKNPDINVKANGKVHITIDEYESLFRNK